MSRRQLVEKDDFINQPSPIPGIPPSAFVKKEWKYPVLMANLTIIQFVCGLLSIGFGVSSVIFSLLRDHYFEYGPGIWGGILYSCTGFFGYISVKTRLRTGIAFYMVMSLINAIYCVIVLLTYTLYFALGVAYNVKEFQADYDSSSLLFTITDFYNNTRGYEEKYTLTLNKEDVFLWVFLMLANFLEALTATVSFIFCYHVLGCCQNESSGAQQARSTFKDSRFLVKIIYIYRLSGNPMIPSPNHQSLEVFEL